jgi:hypothetical protein
MKPVNTATHLFKRRKPVDRYRCALRSKNRGSTLHRQRNLQPQQRAMSRNPSPMSKAIRVLAIIANRCAKGKSCANASETLSKKGKTNRFGSNGLLEQRV